MSKYPLLGNRIEVHAIPEKSVKDRRKYDIYVDESLWKCMRKPDKWKPHETGRDVLKYDATEGGSTTESRYPLRGEGIEIRQQEGKGGDWRQYEIHVDSLLRFRFIEDPEEPTEKEDSASATSRQNSSQTGTKQEQTMEADRKGEKEDKEGWWKHRDGRALGYYANDKGFAPATPITPCG